MAKDELNFHNKRRETKTLENEKLEENPDSKESRPTLSTFFKLPMIVNKFLQTTSVGKKNFSKSRQKNFSESTVASLLKGSEEDVEEQMIDYSLLRKKINLNAVVEEGGHIKQLSDDEGEDKNMNAAANEKNLFVDKRREYNIKYSKIVKGNHDENIDEIISKIMVKQNILTKKLIASFKGKGAKKNPRIKINI